MSAMYDQRCKNYITDILFFLKTWAQISPLDTVLDVACGKGEFKRLLLTEHSIQQIVGIDISEKMLTIAKKKCSIYTQASFKTASVVALLFASNNFNVIVSANLFPYFDNP